MQALPGQPVVGLDVGGANTKAALVGEDGAARLASEPCEVWRDPSPLPAAIARVVDALDAPAAGVALTMTAELADVFPSKRAGVAFVLDAAREALPGRPLRVFSTAGELLRPGEARDRPLDVAASNWLATAMLVARSAPDAILVDCGGTTTDVIPIAGGAVVARGRTDVERLLGGELVYTGALRTPIPSIVGEVPLAAGACAVAAASFAVSADAHLWLGRLRPEDCDLRFPDGRGASPGEVAARLARVVCADPGQLAPGDLDAIATTVEAAQVRAVAGAIARVRDAMPGPPAPVVPVGSGAFLARAAAALAGCDVREPDGPLAQGPAIAPAVALSVIARG